MTDKKASDLITLGWMATVYSTFRHYWRTRSHTEIVISRCGQVINEQYLIEQPWKSKCPYCEMLLASEE